MQIAPRIHQITDTFVNLYLIAEDDGLTLIDAGFSKDGRKVMNQIAELKRTPQSLKRILITHCDGDHVGGVASLKVLTGAHIYANPAEAQAMAAGHSSREMRRDTLTGRLFGVVSTFMKFPPSTADQMLSDGMTLPILGGLCVIATPGHTPGHTSFFSPSTGVLFSGDSIVSRNGVLQLSDRANTWDDAQARESARTQALLGATLVCTGHGPVVMNASDKFPKY
jgi:glyoxylase-like metal-dependent hydrolase (beta-lactamase superfamily II)